MTSTQQIREWLIKMQYTDPNPSEQALQLLCKGPMGPIFQQIIDKVKPKKDVLHVKKSILVHRLLNDNEDIYTENDDIPEINLYNDKRKFEKELNDLNANNVESEANLQFLTSKLKSKNVKLQLLKQKLRETEKDIVLFKAKSLALDTQIETCEKLIEQINILQTKTTEEDLSEKLLLTLTEIEQVITSFDRQILPPSQDSLNPIAEEPYNYLQTSLILSSNKKPLSISKRPKRANSTRKNIFDVSHNFSIISSTLQKNKNLSKISVHSFNNTTLSSNCSNDSGPVDKLSDTLKELECNTWGVSAIQKQIDEMWHYGPEYVFKLLNDLKLRQKKKLIDMIAENSTSVNELLPSSKLNSQCGLEKLYAFHIQTELKRMKCEQQQQKVTKMLETHMSVGINDVTVLETTEFGLQNSISHLRQSVLKMQQECSDNSDKLDQILNEIRSVQDDMITTKTKIETNLCLLYDCNSWLDKIQKNIVENIKEHKFYSDYDLLQKNIAEDDVERFLSCPFQQNNLHYFDSWNKIYCTPEFLEIFQHPFLSPESAMLLNFKQKQWLNKLISTEKHENMFNLKTTFNSDINFEDFENCYKKSLEKLKYAEDKCRETLTGLNDFKTEIKLNLDAPLNDCVAQKMTQNGKSLKEYIEKYDEYYNQLEKI